MGGGGWGGVGGWVGVCVCDKHDDINEADRCAQGSQMSHQGTFVLEKSGLVFLKPFSLLTRI